MEHVQVNSFSSCTSTIVQIVISILKNEGKERIYSSAYRARYFSPLSFFFTPPLQITPSTTLLLPLFSPLKGRGSTMLTLSRFIVPAQYLVPSPAFGFILPRLPVASACLSRRLAHFNWVTRYNLSRSQTCDGRCSCFSLPAPLYIRFSGIMPFPVESFYWICSILSQNLL